MAIAQTMRKNRDRKLDEVQEATPAPYSIQCTSTSGELLKISAVEFEKKILRDADTYQYLLTNLQ